MAKINLEDLQLEANCHGWELVSQEYKNLTSELEWVCPKSHLVFRNYKKMRDSFVCPFCAEEEVKHPTEIEPKHKGTTRIVALDDATEKTGWSVFDDSTLIASGVIEFTQSDTTERISLLRRWLSNLIDNWKPDEVAIEDIQLQTFGNNMMAVDTFKVLARLQGALLVTCFEKKIPCKIVHVSTWRSFCKIKAKQRADAKRAAQLYVEKNYNKNVTQDEADAICIGAYMAESYAKKNMMIDFDNL